MPELFRLFEGLSEKVKMEVANKLLASIQNFAIKKSKVHQNAYQGVKKAVELYESFFKDLSRVPEINGQFYTYLTSATELSISDQVVRLIKRGEENEEIMILRGDEYSDLLRKLINEAKQFILSAVKEGSLLDKSFYCNKMQEAAEHRIRFWTLLERNSLTDNSVKKMLEEFLFPETLRIETLLESLKININKCILNLKGVISQEYIDNSLQALHELIKRTESFKEEFENNVIDKVIKLWFPDIIKKTGNMTIQAYSLRHFSEETILKRLDFYFSGAGIIREFRDRFFKLQNEVNEKIIEAENLQAGIQRKEDRKKQLLESQVKVKDNVSEAEKIASFAQGRIDVKSSTVKPIENGEGYYVYIDKSSVQNESILGKAEKMRFKFAGKVGQQGLKNIKNAGVKVICKFDDEIRELDLVYELKPMGEMGSERVGFVALPADNNGREILLVGLIYLPNSLHEKCDLQQLKQSVKNRVFSIDFDRGVELLSDDSAVESENSTFEKSSTQRLSF